MPRFHFRHICLLRSGPPGSVTRAGPDVSRHPALGRHGRRRRGDGRGNPPFLDRELEASVERRQAHWKRDRTSPEAYATSIAPNRERFRTIIGAVGERVVAGRALVCLAPDSPAKVAENAELSIYAVRWTRLSGSRGRGAAARAQGRDQGERRRDGGLRHDARAVRRDLRRGSRPSAQSARLLAEAGCRVLVPTLIDRSDEFSGNPLVRMTNLPHREWIYRMAFETGRHIIGYEVDEVRAAVDWFTRAGRAEAPDRGRRATAKGA